jgi:hypothetical protein
MFQDSLQGSEPGAPAPQPQPQAAPPVTPPPAQDPAAGQPQQVQQGDPWHGVSREDVIRRYEELNKQHGDLKGEHEMASEIIRQVGPYFQWDRQNQQLHLKEGIVKDYAQQAGWDWAGAPSVQNTPPTQMPQGEPQGTTAMENIESKGEDYLRSLIGEVVNQAMKESVHPLVNEFWQDRTENWVNQITTKYPDFPQWKNQVYDFAKNNGFKLDNIKKLEQAYIATKAINGGMVDKAHLDARDKQLQETLQMIQPNATGGGMPYVHNQNALARMYDPNASTEEIIGMEPHGSDAAAQNVALFGKPGLKPK